MLRLLIQSLVDFAPQAKLYCNAKDAALRMSRITQCFVMNAPFIEPFREL